jgi:hypothetical protein
MAFEARVMAMGDMSPAGLSHAYYNSPDGEPEDIVVEVLGYYDTEEELENNIRKDIEDFESMTGMTIEQGGGWIEVEEID